MKFINTTLNYILLCAVLLGGCMIDNPNQSQGAGKSFLERLDANPEIQQLADEYAYTPPVPVEQSKDTVIIYAYMQADRATNPKTLPPRYRITAAYPSLKVSKVEAVTPEQLGLSLIEGRHLGEVRLPEPYASMPYNKFEEVKQEFEKTYSAGLDAYFAKQQLPSAQCRRIKELLPIFAQEPLVPLLHTTSPSFFAFVDNCAK